MFDCQELCGGLLMANEVNVQKVAGNLHHLRGEAKEPERNNDRKGPTGNDVRKFIEATRRPP